MIMWKRFKRDKSSLIGLVLVVLILLLALFAPLLAPYDPEEQVLSLRRLPPSAEHLFGCDAQGRDILSRILYGARYTLLAGTMCIAISCTIGTSLGLVAGYVGGRLRTIIMRSIDVVLAFPYFLLAILIVAVLGPGLKNAIIAVSITNIPQFTRVVCSNTILLNDREFIEASKSVGASRFRILLSHILPNTLAPIIVLATVGAAHAILSTAALGFIGLGAQPPMPEWGLMLSEGRPYITMSPHLTFFPGLFILFLVLGLNLLGDGLRDFLDPKLR